MSSPADELHALLDERDAARRELSKVYEALHELFVWVQNWPPDFTDDDDWPDTEAKVRAALAGTPPEEKP